MCLFFHPKYFYCLSRESSTSSPVDQAWKLSAQLAAATRHCTPHMAQPWIDSTPLLATRRQLEIQPKHKYSTAHSERLSEKHTDVTSLWAKPIKLISSFCFAHFYPNFVATGASEVPLNKTAQTHGPPCL